MAPTQVTDAGSFEIRQAVVGQENNNTFVLVCKATQESVIIDPSADASTILEMADNTMVKYVLLTHGHPDHVHALAEVQEVTAGPSSLHTADRALVPFKPDYLLNDGDVLPFGEQLVKVLHTPGHTPGSACFLLGSHLFSGDTLFPGGPGKTESPGAFAEIVRSITGKLLVLPDSTLVHPGHGKGLTIGEAKKEYAVFASRNHPPALCGDVLWVES